jgi:hypothetical protein
MDLERVYRPAIACNCGVSRSRPCVRFEKVGGRGSAPLSAGLATDAAFSGAAAGFRAIQRGVRRVLPNPHHRDRSANCTDRALAQKPVGATLFCIERQFDLVAGSMNEGFNRAEVMATFDAVYNVTPMSLADDTRSLNDRADSTSYGSISEIDVVASVIKGALGLEYPQV